MKTKNIDYKIRIHTLPEYLQSISEGDKEDLEETKRIYQLAIDLKLIWRVWMMDEYDRIWIEIEFENGNGEDEWHSLVIEEGTYRKVESDEYTVIVE